MIKENSKYVTKCTYKHKKNTCISVIFEGNRCDALRDLVPSVKFKKREKHLWRSVSFSTKSNTPPWLLFTFLKL